MTRPSSGLHDRILGAALHLFVERGYRGTSLQDIATDVGCSKASLLYHFSNKEAILTELMVPVMREAVILDARLDDLAGPDGADAVPLVVTDFAELAIRYRREVKLLFDNLADATTLDTGYPKLEGFGERLVDAFAGRSTAIEDQVAARMALGGMFLTAADLSLDDSVLRKAMVPAALRMLGRTSG
ncbi:TetR/AcrR family transcriptional regulator [Actinomadura sp. WMMB 499]|uniref:TetR/AcrR family transcriptional regulator n=1 Tax=Actinomadura sp. WMMB 499 TaxID=1219491 RepID=UPI001245DFEB|nr:TetR/AcrR family transcriptional regulator [Actinomadura sp. WMMB 499]QFG21774.1 TetR/AcrR family transcriptional regulator [Actinomadura sp. WMMB 499]